MTKELIEQLAKDVDAIVHGDGNIFFTNNVKLEDFAKAYQAHSEQQFLNDGIEIFVNTINQLESPTKPQEQDELVKKAVADALEDAAKICDDYANSNFGSLVDSGQNGAYVCAKAIRAIIKRNAKEGE